MTTTVRTTHGPVSGSTAGGVREFRGIPFAGPIGAEHRYRAPRPPEPWTEPLEATAWPLMAPQPWGGMSAEDEAYYGDVFGDPYVTRWTEDGLYLNLWTPAADRAARPVMVWLHGGGFFFGQATRERENGSRLAAREDVVVVAPSHRLGLAGYLDPREVFGGEANVGLRDLVLALEWVRDNIAAFGGDPENVTLFGESGGGMKVATLLAMPSAAGLFHRGIIQSGIYPIAGGLSAERSRAMTDAVLEALGDPGKLYELPADELALVPLPAGEEWQPVLDAETLPVPLFDALAAGAGAGIPLIVGTDADELRVLLRGNVPRTSAELAAVLGSQGLADHYAGDGERGYTDFVFRIRAIRFAELRAAVGGAPIHSYLLRWHNPARPDVAAGHGLETPLAFDNVGAVRAIRDAPGAQRLADSMRAAWASFARTGKPLVDGVPWPAYTPDERATVIWDVPPTIENDPGADDRRAWEGHLPLVSPGDV